MQPDPKYAEALNVPACKLLKIFGYSYAHIEQIMEGERISGNKSGLFDNATAVVRARDIYMFFDQDQFRVREFCRQRVP